MPSIRSVVEGAVRQASAHSSRGADGSSTRTAGLTARRKVSTSPSRKNICSVSAPPSTKSRPIPRFSSSVTMNAAETCGARITSAALSSQIGGSQEVKTILGASPRVKNFMSGRRSQLRVRVAFTRSGHLPAAMRSRRSSSPFTNSEGSSRRRVSAPTRMASLDARKRYTSAQSPGVESTSRSGELSSRQPSAERATEANTFIVPTQKGLLRDRHPAASENRRSRCRR